MKVHGILGTHEEQKVLKSSNNCQIDFANHGVQLLRAKFANHKDKMAHLYKIYIINNDSINQWFSLPNSQIIKAKIVDQLLYCLMQPSWWQNKLTKNKQSGIKISNDIMAYFVRYACQIWDLNCKHLRQIGL